MPRKILFAIPVVAAAWSMAVSDDSPPSIPTPTDLPPGKLGEVVALGKDIIERTNEHPLTRDLVGNDLNCTSCHLDAGTDPKAASFIGVATVYPAWSPREERVITLEDRILNCFMRSMNGIRPENGSEASVAMAAYITWLSRDQPLRMNDKAPLGPRSLKPLPLDPATADLERGEAIYAEQCAYCHGDDGVGGDDGPPVWGPRSYNAGAGMAGNEKLSSWLKVAMPLGDPNLSDQEALDVAAFINSHPRPAFRLENHLPQ